MHELSSLLEKLKSNGWKKGKFGLGCIQWTGGRTYNLFKIYKKESRAIKNDFTTIVTDDGWKKYRSRINDEIHGKYYVDIHITWKNKKIYAFLERYLSYCFYCCNILWNF